MSDFI